MACDLAHRRVAANMEITTETSEAQFVAYIESLAEILGHTDRAQPLRDYWSAQSREPIRDEFHHRVLPY
jgi:hypothetical protein